MSLSKKAVSDSYQDIKKAIKLNIDEKKDSVILWSKAKGLKVVPHANLSKEDINLIDNNIAIKGGYRYLVNVDYLMKNDKNINEKATKEAIYEKLVGAYNANDYDNQISLAFSDPEARKKMQVLFTNAERKSIALAKEKNIDEKAINFVGKFKYNYLYNYGVQINGGTVSISWNTRNFDTPKSMLGLHGKVDDKDIRKFISRPSYNFGGINAEDVDYGRYLVEMSKLTVKVADEVEKILRQSIFGK